MTKPTNWHVSSAKTQISLQLADAQSDQSLRCASNANGPIYLQADSEDSDQTGPRLI